MNPLLLFALCIPIAVIIITYFVSGGKITKFEACLHLVLTLVLCGFVWLFSSFFTDDVDYEIWNGEITSKRAQTEYCPYGWQRSTHWFCTEYRTRRVPDGPPRKVCTTVGVGEKQRKECRLVQDYRTEYKYDFPWETRYFINTNVKAFFEISRIDPQGSREPPRFSVAYKGEPVSARHFYRNWVKAASNSIFHQDGQAEDKYRDILPEYPIQIYDLYRINRIVTVGDVQAPVHEMNQQLAMALKQLGPKRQMNAVIVLVDASKAGQDFSVALRRYWKGFKKNDAVLFLGIDPTGNRLVWSESMSWSKNAMYDVAVQRVFRDQYNKQIDFTKVADVILDNGLKYFERREMKEFEHLKEQIPTPFWLILTVLSVSFGGSVGFAYMFHRFDIDSAVF